MGPSFRALVKAALNQLSLPTDVLIYTLCDEEEDLEMHGLAQLDGLGLRLTRESAGLARSTLWVPPQAFQNNYVEWKKP